MSRSVCCVRCSWLQKSACAGSISSGSWQPIIRLDNKPPRITCGSERLLNSWLCSDFIVDNNRQPTVLVSESANYKQIMRTISKRMCQKTRLCNNPLHTSQTAPLGFSEREAKNVLDIFAHFFFLLHLLFFLLARVNIRTQSWETDFRSKSNYIVSYDPPSFQPGLRREHWATRLLM